jgi:hypothetical protein
MPGNDESESSRNDNFGLSGVLRQHKEAAQTNISPAESRRLMSAPPMLPLSVYVTVGAVDQVSQRDRKAPLSNNWASLDCQPFTFGRIFGRDWRCDGLRSRYGLTAGRIWNDRAGIHQISLFSAYNRVWYASTRISIKFHSFHMPSTTHIQLPSLRHSL